MIALVLETFGHVPANDALGQAFDDGGLTDTWLADQHGVVLGAPRQHLDDPADFFITANDRIDFPLPSQPGEVAAIAFQGFIGAFRIGRGDALMAANFLQRRHEPVARAAELLEEPAGGTTVVRQCQEEMFD